MSDPGGGSDPVTTVPIVVKAHAPVIKLELYLHAVIVFGAISALTVLAALGDISGDTVAGLIAALTGINGAVTGLATVKGSP